MFCVYCFHRKSVLFLRRKRLRMKSLLNSKKKGRWVWWHLLLQSGTTDVALTVAQCSASFWWNSVIVCEHDWIWLYFVHQKKKTITDVLSSSEPKPGCPADLQNLVTQYYSDKLSVIEQEELKFGESGQVPFDLEVLSISAHLLIHQAHRLPSRLFQTPASCPVTTWHTPSPRILNRVRGVLN